MSLETQILIAPDIATLRERLRALADRAATHGQPLPPEIQPCLHTHDADEDTRAFVAGESNALPRRMTEDWIVGTPDAVEARLRAYVAEGIRHFMLWFMDAPNPAGLELFAQEISPRFR